MIRRKSSSSTLTAQLQAFAAAEGGAMVDGVPERWSKSPTWRCPTAHVSTRLAADRRGGCVFCGSPVVLTFPEDRSGPLPIENVWLEAARGGNGAVPQQSRRTASEAVAAAGPPPAWDAMNAGPPEFLDEDDQDGSPRAIVRTGLRRPR